MHQEYAINPEAICQSWERFRYFWDACGFSKGRLIAKFPGKWKRSIFMSDAYKQLSPIRQQRIEVLLAEDGDRLIPSQRAYDKDTKSWQQAAIRAHATKAFHAIIDEANPDNHPQVLTFDDVDGGSALWAADTSRQIRRTADRLAACANHLLSNSREIRFIDPYFSFKPEFTASFQGFLQHLIPIAARIECLEVHFKYSQNARNRQWEDFAEEFKRDLSKKQRFYLPAGGEALLQKLVFHAWEDSDVETLHARCIVTETGGLNFERGLDTSIHTGATSLVSMMSPSDVADYITRYSYGSSPFNHKGSFKAAVN